MEAKKLRKQNEDLEFKVESLQSSCEFVIFTDQLLTCTCDYAGRTKCQSHSYTHERLKEQVGVVEAGMYWDMQREYSTIQAEKENAIAEFERIKQEM